MNNWSVEQWTEWFKLRAQPLARNDFVHLRHLATNWDTAGGALCLARGHTMMNSWPAEIEPTVDALRKRAAAFRKINLHCKYLRHAPLTLCIETWNGETLDGWNAKALIFSLRNYHSQRLAAQTAQHRLKPEFYLLAILAICLFANVGTVVFGVGFAAKALQMLLDYFSEIVRLQKQNHAVLEANEEKLRRTLSEAMALEEEFNLLFSEMDVLLRDMERDAEKRVSVNVTA
jgi:hypothetical protein